MAQGTFQGSFLHAPAWLQDLRSLSFCEPVMHR